MSIKRDDLVEPIKPELLSSKIIEAVHYKQFPRKKKSKYK